MHFTSKVICRLLLSSCILLFFASPACSGNSEIEDILKNFDSDQPPCLSGGQEVSEQNQSDKISKTYPYSQLTGSLRLNSDYAFRHHHPLSSETDFQEFTSFRPFLGLSLQSQINPKLQAKISAHTFYDLSYVLNDRENFSDELLASEQETELEEAAIGARISDKMDIKIGRQVMLWGKTDFLSPVDILNPTDNRLPGLTDPDQTRLPTWMSRLDYYEGGWKIHGVIIHEFRGNKEPAFGSDFYPFAFRLPPLEEPDSIPDRQGYAFSAGTTINGWNAMLHYASLVKEQSWVGLTDDTSFRRTNRLNMVGISSDKSIGPWLFKFETAGVSGLRYYALPDSATSRFDLSTGFEYSGLTNTRVNLEVLYQHLFDLDLSAADDFFLPKRNVLLWSFQLSHTFFNDRFKVSLYSFNAGYDFSNGSAQKISCTYSLSDAVDLSAGIILYQSGDNYLMENIGGNDRLFGRAKYSF